MRLFAFGRLSVGGEGLTWRAARKQSNLRVSKRLLNFRWREIADICFKKLCGIVGFQWKTASRIKIDAKPHLMPALVNPWVRPPTPQKRSTATISPATLMRRPLVRKITLLFRKVSYDSSYSLEKRNYPICQLRYLVQRKVVGPLLECGVAMCDIVPSACQILKAVVSSRYTRSYALRLMREDKTREQPKRFSDLFDRFVVPTPGSPLTTNGSRTSPDTNTPLTCVNRASAPSPIRSSPLHIAARTHSLSMASVHSLGFSVTTILPTTFMVRVVTASTMLYKWTRRPDFNVLICLTSI